MTIKQLLQKGIKILAHKSQTAQLDCEVLLSFILKKDKTFLIANSDKELNKEQEKSFLEFIQRRVNYEPIAYITNQKEFYSLPFYVDENVLIPRPETEELVDLAYTELKRLAVSGKQVASIIDIGTGSGCIGITLIHRILEERLNKDMKFTFYLTDISGKTIKVARKNFKKLVNNAKNIKVHFIKTDLLKRINVNFDIVVSNPPYIPNEDMNHVDPTVKDYEPRKALEGGEGGMEIVEQLISEAVNRLSSGGIVLLEIHEKHPQKIKYFMKQEYPDLEVKFYKDSFGEWRFVKINCE